MVGDKYILEPEAILDHCVAAEGKRWYLVKWKPKWVKKHELPEGVYEKWEAKKAKRAKLEEEGKTEEPEPEEEESGFRILEERRVIPGQEPEETEDGEDEEGHVNGDGGEDEDEDDEEGLDDDEDEEEEPEDDDEEENEENEEIMDDEDEDEELDGIEVKEEPDDDEEYNGGVNEDTEEDLNALSSIDRDIVLNGLPGEMDLKEEAEIKEEEDRISIPKNYTKPYS